MAAATRWRRLRVVGFAERDQAGGGVEDDNVAAGPGSPSRIWRMIAALAAGLSTAKSVERLAGDAEVFGVQVKSRGRSPRPLEERESETLR